MKEFRSTDEITKEDFEKMYNAIVKFDNYISSVTRKLTDENIGLYEHWIDCRYDIEKLIVKYAAVMKRPIRELAIYEIDGIDKSGCKYFSTKEKAKAKLKELRGENE